MTRAQRLRALADVLSEVTSVAEQADFGHVAEAALDAALADLGGLDGLTRLLDLTDDRLLELLLEAERALADNEAGT